jgi:hypothetical protein
VPVDSITIIDYARTRIGTADVLMPQTGDVHLIEFSGEENRNVVEFTHCRSFNAESSISFTSADSPAPVATSAERVPTIPRRPGKPFPAVSWYRSSSTLQLPDQAAIGEVIEAKVSGNVQYKGHILIPNGSVVRGRVRRLEQYSQPESYFIVALELNEIQAGASLLRFYADMQNIEGTPGVERFLSYSTSVSSTSSAVRGISPASGHEYAHSQRKVIDEEIRVFDLLGVGSFFVRRAHVTLPNGLIMTCKTRALAH